MEKGQYLKGMLCLLLVNCLNVTSSVLTKEILGGGSFRNPLFLTYVSAAMYTVCLVRYLPLIYYYCTTRSTNSEGYGLLEADSKSVEISADKPTEVSAKSAVEPTNRKVLKISMITDKGESQNMKPISSVDASVGVTSCVCFVVKQNVEKIPLLETIKLSGVFGSVLFVMNYLFNAAMLYTSQGTSTVLSSLSSPFTLVLSAVILKEPLAWSRMVGVAVVLAGSSWIAFMDASVEGDHDGDGVNAENIEINLNLGDLLAVVSALVYAFYSVLMKFWIKDDSRLSMPLYLGLVGFWNTICLWPLLLIFNNADVEHFKFPDNTSTIAFLVLNGCLSLLFEICWMRSILLISPVIASVGLGLSVPLSVLADYLIYHKDMGPKYYLAAMFVVVGFVLTNLNVSRNIGRKSNPQTSGKELLEDLEAV